MTYAREEVALLAPGPGTQQSLVFHRFGDPAARPKAMIQASLHADEIPAMMAAHHLLQLLDAAEREGRITGQILLVPYANPIGLAQWVNEQHLGRYELRSGGNFNRDWNDLSDAIAERLAGHLSANAEENLASIRRLAVEILSERQPNREIDSLKLALSREAVTADLLLDLHCDDEALLHLFLLPQHWPDAADLAAALGAEAVLVDEDSAGAAFDETHSGLWLKLQRRFPDHPIPPACLASTVELRGQADVSDTLGQADAKALFDCLVGRGYIEGAKPALPPLRAEATPLKACQNVITPVAGIVAYAVALGDHVAKGEVLAEIVDPAAPAGAKRTPLRAKTDGLVLSLRAQKLVAAGQVVAKIVGSEPLPPEDAFQLQA
ncbi:MAG: succinylglutamate desuccinylase/aspartoacylase family protein [Pseudomonadota bacterium]